MSKQKQMQEETAQFNKQASIGLMAAYKAMLAFKQYKQSPVVISHNRQILHVPASEMPPAPAGDGEA